MRYSVRMRAAQGGAHEAGGRHISGAERLVAPAQLLATTQAMVERALAHSRGRADFIRLTIEAVPPASYRTVPLLPWSAVACANLAAGRAAALEALAQAGVAPQAARAGLEALAALPDSLRGAMVLCARDGRRLDATGARGVRVSRMDAGDEEACARWLAAQGLTGDHPREAMVLAAKVAAAPGMVAELCWSDDPEYTTGYVASPAQGYVRIPCLKKAGSPNGGRAFFVHPGADLAALRHFLEEEPVLLTPPEEGDNHEAP